MSISVITKIQIIKSFFRYLALFLLLLTVRVSAQEDSVVISEIQTGHIVSMEDTLSGKDLRKAKQRERYENSGKFFDHSVKPARKAAFYSFGFPGLGQIYNRKFWKLPIVYGVVGTGLYFTAANGKELRRYNNALERELRMEPHEFDGILSESQIIERRNFYRRNTELSAILTGFAYGLNIIDAVVDAHLFEFDISDDLSLHWYPNFLTGNNGPIPVIQLSLAFN